jgi:hypothetical protein
MNVDHPDSDFLSAVLDPLRAKSKHSDRPFVTLTFAQSLDAKIAGIGGQQLILSGRDSMVMTHRCAHVRRPYAIISFLNAAQDENHARCHSHWNRNRLE